MLTPRQALIALSGFAGASIILAHRIAASSPYGAFAAFRACMRTATELKDISTPVDYRGSITAAHKILYSGDTTALTFLLVDIIRIANHTTRN